MAVKNEELKQIMEQVAGHVILLSADMADVKKANEKVDLALFGDNNGHKGVIRKLDAFDTRLESLGTFYRIAKWAAGIIGALFIAHAVGSWLETGRVKSLLEITPAPNVIIVTATPIPVFREPTMPPQATASPKQRYEPSEDELAMLAKLCTVEVRDMAGVRDTACLSVVSTVITRLTSGIMGGISIKDTIARGCYPDTIHCPFPAHVVWGCDGIIARACADSYPLDITHFTHVVESYFEGERGDCDGYLSYGIKSFDLHQACVIQAANGLYQGWHDRP